MILAIDVGNTNIVAALVRGNEVIQKCRYDTLRQEEEQYHSQYLTELVRNENLSGVIISSVVPEINDTLKKVCKELTGISPIFVSDLLHTGLTIRYDNPHKLGADLIAVAVGAVHQYGCPVIVIDIGTATTFSIINDKREYLGGMIAPGPYVSMKALASMTSQLLETELTVTDKIIGTNTVDCIRIGILTAHSAMIDGMLERVISSLGMPDMKIVATGGFADQVTAMCTHKMIDDANLIFKGLYTLYQMNCC